MMTTGNIGNLVYYLYRDGLKYFKSKKNTSIKNLLSTYKTPINYFLLCSSINLL